MLEKIVKMVERMVEWKISLPWYEYLAVVVLEILVGLWLILMFEYAPNKWFQVSAAIPFIIFSSYFLLSASMLTSALRKRGENLFQS